MSKKKKELQINYLDLSPANIQKIENLIREMGYVQKMGLRVLNKEKSQLIAVVINYHKDFKDSIDRKSVV